MVDVFRKGTFELLALTKTMLKGNGCCGVNDIIADIQDVERVREGIAVLMSDEWHSAVIDFGC